jgi:hypothetical protein
VFLVCVCSDTIQHTKSTPTTNRHQPTTYNKHSKQIYACTRTRNQKVLRLRGVRSIVKPPEADAAAETTTGRAAAAGGKEEREEGRGLACPDERLLLLSHEVGEEEEEGEEGGASLSLAGAWVGGLCGV